MRPFPRSHRARLLGPPLRPAFLAGLGLLCTLPHPAAGQIDVTGTRIGLTFGSTSLIGLSVEFFDDDKAIDITVGTWSFHDVSLSVTAKALVGGTEVRPSVGLGLTTVVGWDASGNPDATRTGVTILARAPIGLDWRVSGSTFITTDLSWTRALLVRRTVASDDRPPSSRFVKIPGIAFRATG